MAQVNVRIDDKVKKEAENVLDEMGMPMTTAVTIFLKTVARERRILKSQRIHFIRNIICAIWNRR